MDPEVEKKPATECSTAGHQRHHTVIALRASVFGAAVLVLYRTVYILCVLANLVEWGAYIFICLFIYMCST